MNRNRELARIHCLAKEIGLDDTTYRDVLWAVARVKSAADLDEYGRRKLIAHLSSRRSTPSRPRPHPGPLPGGEGIGKTKARGAFGRPPNSLATRPLLKKIEAQLGDHYPQWEKAQANELRRYRKDVLEFCSDSELAGVIAALWRDAHRHPEKSHANRDFRTRCAERARHKR